MTSSGRNESRSYSDLGLTSTCMNWWIPSLRTGILGSSFCSHLEALVRVCLSLSFGQEDTHEYRKMRTSIKRLKRRKDRTLLPLYGASKSLTTLAWYCFPWSLVPLVSLSVEIIHRPKILYHDQMTLSHKVRKSWPKRSRVDKRLIVPIGSSYETFLYDSSFAQAPPSSNGAEPHWDSLLPSN